MEYFELGLLSWNLLDDPNGGDTNDPNGGHTNDPNGVHTNDPNGGDKNLEQKSRVTVEPRPNHSLPASQKRYTLRQRKRLCS
jgi:hypothetical protein